MRSAFQMDRDRIVYSNAFRRLKHKTQVFLTPMGDDYRTRLTHTLEVAEEVCDRIAIINRGEIIAAGTMAQLRAHPQENLEQVFMRLVGEADAYYTEGFDYEG